MHYWWVNQNQTFKQEFNGGYIWSPKRKSNDTRNPFYEFMRGVAPGDVIFSFADTYIKAIGIAQSVCYEFPKPSEFGTIGGNWHTSGWKVSVRYFKLVHAIRPADYMEILGPLLPTRYSPLQANGKGLQGVYLTMLSSKLAFSLANLIGKEAKDLIAGNRVNYPGDAQTPDPDQDQTLWENHLYETVKADKNLSESQRVAVVLARRGQGEFKKNVRKLESCCRVTGVRNIAHLVASHCKPWRDCETYEERLAGENGLLLTPSIDHLFDRGLITFENSGKLLVSPVADKIALKGMGIPIDHELATGPFSAGQNDYLDFHRERVFLESSVK